MALIDKAIVENVIRLADKANSSPYEAELFEKSPEWERLLAYIEALPFENIIDLLFLRDCGRDEMGMREEAASVSKAEQYKKGLYATFRGEDGKKRAAYHLAEHCSSLPKHLRSACELLHL